MLPFDGEVIRRLRRERKWNADDLAERAGISKAYVYDIENEKKTPSMKVLDRIAEALDVSTSTLMRKRPSLGKALDALVPMLTVNPYEDIGSIDMNFDEIRVILESMTFTNPYTKRVFDSFNTFATNNVQGITVTINDGDFTFQPQKPLRDAILYLSAIYLGESIQRREDEEYGEEE